MTEGLRRSVDGDAGYSGLITKNPEHRDWEATWLTDHLYSLPELEEHLTDHGHMPPPSWQERKRKKPVGLGRNCTLFETARVWAYREIRHHWGDPEGLRTAIVHEAHALNGSSPRKWCSDPSAIGIRLSAREVHRCSPRSRDWW